MMIELEPGATGDAAKILDLTALGARVASLRAQGKRIVHCHGVFDLLHPGHIRHLAEAKAFGDVLVVTITEDRYVNKGPNRPAFPHGLRAESLAALAAVDYVAVNHFPTAMQAIAAIKPDVYAKGPDYKHAADDVTGKIVDEEAAVRAYGGTIAFTEDITFSSSALLNAYLPSYPLEVQAYLRELRARYSVRDVIAALDRLADVRVVLVGETILDEYVYCDQMGKSAKEPVLAMRHRSTELYAGGVLAAANHLADFCKSVEVVTYLGAIDGQEKFVRENLRPKVRLSPIYKRDSPTIVKRRYVEATLATKMFEVYVINDDDLDAEHEADLCALLEIRLAGSDLVIAADFGHGLLTPASKQLLASKAKFLAVNTQINAANVRYHAISSYPRADYVCINEAELRLDARNRYGAISELVAHLATKLDCDRFLVTRGAKGVSYFDGAQATGSPALTTSVVDRVGSGDAVLAITSACVAAGIPADLVAFFANVIGAQKVKIMGNRSSIERAATIKFIQALLK
jgi:rfaE bifunctional protein nucleotidyltransferase chain/domain